MTGRPSGLVASNPGILWWCYVVIFSECVLSISICAFRFNEDWILFCPSSSKVPGLNLFLPVYSPFSPKTCMFLQFLLLVRCVLQGLRVIEQNCVYDAWRALPILTLTSPSDILVRRTALPIYVRLSTSLIDWPSSMMGASHVLFILMVLIFLTLISIRSRSLVINRPDYGSVLFKSSSVTVTLWCMVCNILRMCRLVVGSAPLWHCKLSFNDSLNLIWMPLFYLLSVLQCLHMAGAPTDWFWIIDWLNWV